mmetsp:Transcript_53431/g.97867  ORF Transcript_53431/g.97867 Transcript_53431/m.97867 type:complete len:82 (-) Transcript_53431:669-914(-)
MAAMESEMVPAIASVVWPVVKTPCSGAGLFFLHWPLFHRRLHQDHAAVPEHVFRKTRLLQAMLAFGAALCHIECATPKADP